MSLEIVEGIFAEISTGNCSWGWILDGDDVQERANAELGTYWSNNGELSSTVRRQAFKGFGVRVVGLEQMSGVYRTRAFAESAIKRAEAQI